MKWTVTLKQKLQ